MGLHVSVYSLDRMEAGMRRSMGLHVSVCSLDRMEAGMRRSNGSACFCILPGTGPSPPP